MLLEQATKDLRGSTLDGREEFTKNLASERLDGLQIRLLASVVKRKERSEEEEEEERASYSCEGRWQPEE